MLNLREVHLILLALWGGVVLCESTIEFIPYKFPKSRPYSVLVHYWIDVLIELPILSGVTGTGILLAKDTAWDLHITSKIVFGSLTVMANLFCIVMVVRRYKIQYGKTCLDAVETISRQIVWIGLVGTFFAILSVLFGFRFFNLAS